MPETEEALVRELTYLRGYMHCMMPLLQVARVATVVIAGLMAVIAIELLIRS